MSVSVLTSLTATLPTIPAAAVAPAAGLLDAATGALVGRPTRVRVATGPALIAGRSPRVHLRAGPLVVEGLEIAEVDVRLNDVALVPGWPPRLRAARARARVRIEGSALTAWSRAARLPLRLAVRDGALVVRAGVAGMRLGEARASLELSDGRLVVVPTSVGVGGRVLRGVPLLPVRLPLPGLPAGASLERVAVGADAVWLVLEAAPVDQPCSPAALRALRSALA